MRLSNHPCLPLETMRKRRWLQFEEDPCQQKKPQEQEKEGLRHLQEMDKRIWLGLGLGMSNKENIEGPVSSRLTALRSHLSPDSSSSAMASEKEAALAAAPSDAPTIFDKIIKKEIPANVVYEDDKVLLILFICWDMGHSSSSSHSYSNYSQRDGLTGLSKAEERHFEILGCLLYAAKLVPKQEGLEDGFRVVINDGPQGCQSVYHIHIHLLGGCQMNWPPG
ncbi:hypothetical protein SLEP1_g53090 [Rubroshorea leprosula]|uniref:HIT domain-containing protein n=1 Tax=Rubroshorea leprosula TaxID=152421 RepID=A0AAV5M9B0_9ROSI|nr:hypothetical protein SLEP1_g53090 [Rubroshorea leprosula]